MTQQPEQIILTDGKAILTKTRFIHENKTYPLQNIYSASLKEGGLLGIPKLSLTMKSGNIYVLKVGKVSNGAYANAFFSGGLIDTMSSELKAAVSNWVTTINMLKALGEK